MVMIKCTIEIYERTIEINEHTIEINKHTTIMEPYIVHRKKGTYSITFLGSCGGQKSFYNFI